MAFDFDEVIDRRGTHSLKWDGMAQRFGLTDPDVIPMWVADMDFRAPDSVTQALKAALDHGVYGYYGDDSTARKAVANWLATRHGWTPDTDWIGWAHGLVAGIGFSIQAFTEPGDGIAVFSPVYHMFANSIRAAGRRVVESPLKMVQGRYEMDIEQFARDIDPDTRMVLLCSPHNPGGRVWSEAELSALADFCVERDLILVSDEIHNDLVYSGSKHHVTAKAAPQVLDRLVTLVAPTKTFNVAAALTGAVIISNPDLREKFQAAKAASGSGASNGMGMIILEAAFNGGAPWLDALVPYLEANRDRLASAVASSMPGLRSMHLEATYLAWIDFSALGLDPEAAAAKVETEAKIAVNRGPTFGQGGESWLRFNFACPRATLDRAIERMTDVFGA